MVKASFLIEHTTSKKSIPSSRYSSSESQAMHSCPLVDSFVTKGKKTQGGCSDGPTVKWNRSGQSDRRGDGEIALICVSVPYSHDPYGICPTCHFQSELRAVSVITSCLTSAATLTFTLFPLSGKIKQKLYYICVRGNKRGWSTLEMNRNRWGVRLTDKYWALTGGW